MPTFPTEYGDIQREYPIFFRKDPRHGESLSVALLGFAQDENLFLQDGMARELRSGRHRPRARSSSAFRSRASPVSCVSSR